MNSVFVVQHLYKLPQDEDDVKLIGVYDSRAAAIAAVERLSSQPGFRDHPTIVDHEAGGDDQGFHMTEYELGRDHWTEGYVTLPE